MTGTRQMRTARTVEEARAVNELSTAVRVNRVPITSFGAVSRVAGPSGANAPMASLTFTMDNQTGATVKYKIGDPEGVVAGNLGTTWQLPTKVKFGSVASTIASLGTNSITVKGINYIVSDASQYEEALMYFGGDRDGRFSGQPIDIDAILRNNQEIATRQTIMFEEDYLLDSLHAFVFDVKAGVKATISLLLGANAA